jgi:hypothetical protein
MIYICIQSKENSLGEHTADDGGGVECNPPNGKNENEDNSSAEKFAWSVAVKKAACL